MDVEGGRAALITLVGAVVLSLVIPFWLVLTVPDVGRSNAWVLCLVLMGYSGVRLSFLFAAGKTYLFDYFFYLFVYVFIGLAATVQIRSGMVAATTRDISPTLDGVTAVVTVAGVGAYEIGRLLSRGRDRDPDRRATWLESDLLLNRSLWLYGIGILLTSYYISRVGPATLLSTREGLSSAIEAVWPDSAQAGIVRALAVFPLLVAVGALVAQRAELYRLIGTIATRSLIVVGTVAVVFAQNPVSSARYTAGTVLFAVVVFLGVVGSASRTRLTMAGFLLAFLFLFPVADAFRFQNQTSDVRTSFFGEYAGNGDYDAFWQIANAVDYIQSTSLEPMRQFTGSVLFWVPRSIWASKPVDTGVLLADFRGYEFTNLSAPLWAESLVNLGYAGVPVVFFLAGYFLRPVDVRIDRAFKSEHDRFFRLVGAIIPVYGIIILRGSLLQATGTLTVIIACALFVRGPSRE